MINLVTEIEIAWLAGLFEGVSYFGLDTRSVKRYNVSTSPPPPFIKLAMVDKDIIERVSKLVNKNYFPQNDLLQQGNKFISFILEIGKL
jgi:hypothetical protein